jgi:hypothetical protein
VREDRRNAAAFTGRFGSPGGRVKMFDKDLVHAIIGGKDLHCGSAELSVNLVLTRGHGPCSLTNDTSGPSVIRLRFQRADYFRFADHPPADNRPVFRRFPYAFLDTHVSSCKSRSPVGLSHVT